MKRIIVWVDSSDKDAHEVEKRLKDYLTKTGVQHTMFEDCEVLESENE